MTTSSPSELDLGLSFSGGGYRAAAYSLGTMALLQDLNLMARAQVLSGVSGGSLAVGAYLCGKAGSGAQIESQFDFYQSVYIPLSSQFDTENFAADFASLPALLSGEKIVLRAAQSSQKLMSDLLGEAATFDSRALSTLLNHDMSPNYVFFNTTNIRGLDLFRFGLQRPNLISPLFSKPLQSDSSASITEAAMADSDDYLAKPIYVLNRYFVAHDQNPDSVYHHARSIRLGDCIASSYAFPCGFEPLIFPNDFFCHASTHDPGALAADQAAINIFSNSLICDREPYLAFLDGGLYDNLGLASIDDVRSYHLRRQARSTDRQDAAPPSSDPSGQRSTRQVPPRIRFVLATDVDNIQPNINAYAEASLDQPGSDFTAQGSPTVRPARESSRPGRFPSRVIILIVGVVIGLLISTLFQSALFLLGTISLGHTFVLGLIALASIGLLLALISIGIASIRIKRIRAVLQRIFFSPGQASVLSSLGFSPQFASADSGGLDSNLGRHFLGIAAALMLQPLERLETRMAKLKVAILERRLGQLLPAFNGYLKRTRTLTYGYLQQAYSHSSKTSDWQNRCYLIRNMIFELTAGPDMDPEESSRWITLPVESYADAVHRPVANPLAMKIGKADLVAMVLSRNLGPHSFVAGWELSLVKSVLRRHGDQPGSGWQSKSISALSGWQDVSNSLNLVQAASIWIWLRAQLEYDPNELEQLRSTDFLPAYPIRCVVERVVKRLRQVISQQDHQGTLHALMRRHCEIKKAPWALADLDRKFRQTAGDRPRSGSVEPTAELDPYVTSSWIPLIFEMATNLNTTFWICGFRWYVLNRLEENGTVSLGGWYSYDPTTTRFGSGRTILDFGIGHTKAITADLTILAGYMGSGFNLLEFAYSLLAEA